jgi:hypothetical protein
MKIQSKMIKSLSIFLLIFAFQSSAELDPVALNCAGLENNSERLNCFDQWIASAQTNNVPTANTDSSIVTTVDNNASIPVPVSAPVPVPAPLVLSTNTASDEQFITKTIPAKPVVVADNNEQSQEQLEQGFGIEHNRTQQEDDTDDLIFTITHAKKSLREKWTLTFSNGQKWKTITSARIKFKADEQVMISRGALSSFILQHVDGQKTVKVKRLQ